MKNIIFESFLSQLWTEGRLDLSGGVWECIDKEMNKKRPNRSIIDMHTERMFRGQLVDFEKFELLYNMGDDVSGESKISIMRKFMKAYTRLEFRDAKFEIKTQCFSDRSLPYVLFLLAVVILYSILQNTIQFNFFLFCVFSVFFVRLGCF